MWPFDILSLLGKTKAAFSEQPKDKYVNQK
jgi:hypothetical protein